MTIKTEKEIMEVEGIGIEGEYIVVDRKNGKREAIGRASNIEEAQKLYQNISKMIENYYEEKGELIIRME